MKVSHKWLQEYISEKLPSTEDISSSLTMHSFEIEGMEDKDGDKILDVKVLPNRSHDCLCHYGIASEIASVLNLDRVFLLPNQELSKTDKIKLTVSTKFCTRAVMILIENVKVGSSPSWLKEKLRSLGFKSINSVVDITNYLMYAFGQPMHAFDADKISKVNVGSFDMNIRDAKDGEKITLLNGLEYKLDPSVMVISDGEKVLDVAGVMGGNDSGVDVKTKNIILSLSSFDSISVRKTSKKLAVRTDASQRFENEISPYLIDRVLPYALKYISELAGGTIVGKSEFYPNPQQNKVIPTTVQKISSILGISLDATTIIYTLGRQKISAVKDGDKILVTAPLERLDLEIEENIAEEVGRLYGLEKISPTPLSQSDKKEINKEIYFSNTIRRILVDCGFSEVYTYSFVSSGDVEVDNPLASDKKFLRKNLLEKMEYSLEHNFKFLDLLAIPHVKLFEIGRVFRKDGEFLHLSIGIKYPKGKKEDGGDGEIAQMIDKLKKEFGVSFGEVSIVGGVAELDLEVLLKSAEVPKEYSEDLFKTSDKEVSYKTISPYPFAIRDVAVFVPNDIDAKKVEELIKNKITDIVIRFSLFDTFVKGDKTSYAFRLVFQSQEKTLTDEEINAVLDSIYKALKLEPGFEIR